MEIFLIIVFIFIIIILPHTFQWRMDYIHVEFFKKISIKKCWFLFTAMNIDSSLKKDNKWVIINDGIILPMFLLELLGYILAVSIIITLLVFLIIKTDLFLLFFISGILIAVELGIDIITIFVTWRISKKRKRLHDKKYSNK